MDKIRYILENIHTVEKVKKLAYSVRHNLMEYVLQGKITENDFYKITSLLTPQSRSPLWQNYFIEKNGFDKLKSKENKGDCVKNGICYEYKASGFNEGSGLHVIQIRLWQDCDYIIQFIEKDKVYTFILTKEEMKEEIQKCGSTSAHGTKEANESNENVELRLSTIRKGDKNWNRWVKKYLQTE